MAGNPILGRPRKVTVKPTLSTDLCVAFLQRQSAEGRSAMMDMAMQGGLKSSG
jgi:hypothetical protein